MSDNRLPFVVKGDEHVTVSGQHLTRLLVFSRLILVPKLMLELILNI